MELALLARPCTQLVRNARDEQFNTLISRFFIHDRHQAKRCRRYRAKGVPEAGEQGAYHARFCIKREKYRGNEMLKESEMSDKGSASLYPCVHGLSSILLFFLVEFHR
jgi:hypothetical protein